MMCLGRPLFLRKLRSLVWEVTMFGDISISVLGVTTVSWQLEEENIVSSEVLASCCSILLVGKFVSILTGLDATDCYVSSTIKERVNNRVKNNYVWTVITAQFCESFTLPLLSLCCNIHIKYTGQPTK